jgi:hypothetical protein
VDWVSQIHHHSISGFAFFVGIGAVSWSSKKQPIITLSSTEAEYIALTHSSKDIIWIHKSLTEFLSIFSFTVPTTLYCDNQGAICLSKDSTFHGHTKHIVNMFTFTSSIKLSPTSNNMIHPMYSTGAADGTLFFFFESTIYNVGLECSPRALYKYK